MYPVSSKSNPVLLIITTQKIGIEKTRRKYYRKVEIEKLRFAESGINQYQIKAVCRYLANFNNHHKLREILVKEHPQLIFEFFYLT